MKFMLITATLIMFNSSYAQKTKTIVEYQKRQVIDLGALQIDGELVTPGDFTVDDEKIKATELLYKRKNYNDRLRINIEYVF